MSDQAIYKGTLSATVTVESAPSARPLVAVEAMPNGSWRVCGSGTSGADGQLAMPVAVVSADSEVYVMAADEWGMGWSSSLAVNVGDVVRPMAFDGWVYRVTTAGTLDATEPAWWAASKIGPQPVGTAMLEAVRYQRPLAHGPVPLTYSMDSDPYWSQVVSVMNFQGADGGTSFVDGTGKVFSKAGSPVIVEGHALVGESSAYLRGSYLQAPTSSDWAFGLGDFTIEMVLSPELIEPVYYDAPLGNWSNNNGWCFFIRPDGALEIRLNNIILASAAGALKALRWYYIAARRRNGIISLCIGTQHGGVQVVASSDAQVDLARTDGIRVGNNQTSSDMFEGFVNMLRITKGVGRDFAMPTQPFLIGG